MGLLSKAVKQGLIDNPQIITKKQDEATKLAKDKADLNANDPNTNPTVYDEQMADPNVTHITVPEDPTPVLGSMYGDLVNTFESMPFYGKETISGANVIEQLNYYVKNIQGRNMPLYKFMEKRGAFNKFRDNPKKQFTKKEILDSLKDFSSFEFRIRTDKDTLYRTQQRLPINESAGDYRKIGYAEITLHAPLDNTVPSIKEFADRHFKGNTIGHTRSSFVYNRKTKETAVMPEEMQGDLFQKIGKKADIIRNDEANIPTYDNFQETTLAGNQTMSLVGVRSNWLIDESESPSWFTTSFIAPTRSYNSLKENLRLEYFLMEDNATLLNRIKEGRVGLNEEVPNAIGRDKDIMNIGSPDATSRMDDNKSRFISQLFAKGFSPKQIRERLEKYFSKSSSELKGESLTERQIQSFLKREKQNKVDHYKEVFNKNFIGIGNEAQDISGGTIDAFSELPRLSALIDKLEKNYATGSATRQPFFTLRYMQSSLFDTLKNMQNEFDLKAYNNDKDFFEFKSYEKIRNIHKQKLKDIQNTMPRTMVSGYDYRNPSAIPVFMQRFAAHGFNMTERTDMINNILSKYNLNYFRGVNIRKGHQQGQVTDNEYQRLLTDGSNNYAGQIKYPDGSMKTYMNANERFLRYFDEINEDRQIGASTWSDHHPEYQDHLIQEEFKLPNFEDAYPDISQPLPYNFEDTKKRMKKIVDDLNEQYNAINAARYALSKHLTEALEQDTLHLLNVDPIGDTTGPDSRLTNVTMWRFRKNDPVVGKDTGDYGRYYDSGDTYPNRISTNYEQKFIANQNVVTQHRDAYNKKQDEIIDLENDPRLNDPSGDDGLSEKLDELYDDLAYIELDIRKTKQKMLRELTAKNIGNFATLFDPYEHVFDPKQINELKLIDFDEIVDDYGAEQDPRFGASFVAHVMREVTKQDYLNGLNDFGYTVFSELDMNRLKNTLSSSEARKTSLEAYQRLEDLSYNPLKKDDYITKNLDRVIEKDDIPIGDKLDFMYKMVIGQMMLAKELGTNKVIIPNASELINLREPPTPEQMIKLKKFKAGANTIHSRQYKKYLEGYDELKYTRPDGTKYSERQKRKGKEDLYNKSRVLMMDLLKKRFGDDVNIYEIKQTFDSTHGDPPREVPATVIEFNFDFDPKKQMIKYRKGGLVEIDNMRESKNLFTDPKAFGDDEYRQNAIREAMEAGVISFNFNEGGVTDPAPKPSMIDYMTRQDYEERAGELFKEDDLYRKYPGSFYAYRKQIFDFPDVMKKKNMSQAMDQKRFEEASPMLGSLEFEADIIPKFRTTALGKLGFYSASDGTGMPDPKVEKADEAYQGSQGSFRPSDMTITLTNDPEEGKRIRALRRITTEKDPLFLPPYSLPHPELERMYTLNAENPTPEHEAIHRAILILQNYYANDRDYVVKKYGEETANVLFDLLNPSADNNYFQLSNEVLTEQNDAIRSGAKFDSETYLRRTLAERDEDLENYKARYKDLFNEKDSLVNNVERIVRAGGEQPRHILNRIISTSREGHADLVLSIFDRITKQLPNLEELAKERLYDRNPKGGPTFDARGIAEGSLDEGFYDKLKVDRASGEETKNFLQRQLQKFRDRRNLKSNIRASESMNLGGRF